GSAYQALDSSAKFIAAGRVAVGSIVGASLQDVPADRRFYAGGGGSVRGYAYQGIGPKAADGQPIGGLSWFETSVEMRYRVTDTIGIVPFVDAGTVSTKQFPDFADVKVGAGVGLRYITPFGPLRVDAAVPLNRGPGDPRFGIYAGIGQAFCRHDNRKAHLARAFLSGGSGRGRGGWRACRADQDRTRPRQPCRPDFLHGLLRQQQADGRRH